MKYEVTIEETLSKTVEITALSPEEAMDIAENMYKAGAIVLCGDNCYCKQMAITAPGSEATEFVEF